MSRYQLSIGLFTFLAVVALQGCSADSVSGAAAGGTGGQVGSVGACSPTGRAGAASAPGADTSESAGESGAAGNGGIGAAYGSNGGNGAAAAGAGGAIGTGEGSDAGSPGGAAKVAETFTLQRTRLGQVIGTAAGLTLYVFKPDTPAVAGYVPGVSACAGPCLITWPFYYTDLVSVPEGLSASDFGSFDRGGGVMQSTFQGWPLYTYSGDAKAGDVNGDGTGGRWYATKDPFAGPGSTTFTLQTTSLGDVIGTSEGLTLYAFKADTPAAGQSSAVSACTGACLSTWPAYYGSPASVPVGLSVLDFGSFDRGGGVMQSTFKGWPVYTYSGDPKTGDANGDGIARKWYATTVPFAAPGMATFTLQATSLGEVVGTAGGLTLYAFKSDTPGAGQAAAVSACAGVCLNTWPAYYGSPRGVPVGLSASDFGSFDRGGGVLQSTFKGWPLYTYSSDAKAGDVNGDGTGDKWYATAIPFTAPGATSFTP